MTIYTVLKLSGRILQVQVAVENILLLRWKQRAHTLLVLGGFKGHIRAPMGAILFGKGLARTQHQTQ